MRLTRGILRSVPCLKGDIVEAVTDGLDVVVAAAFLADGLCVG